MPRRAQFQEARKELVAENRARYPITCSLISGWALYELKAYKLNSWGLEFRGILACLLVRWVVGVLGLSDVYRLESLQGIL